ncbi:hypothetical protein [Halalkalicoccus ordinarius]|uniref:hypothetical protein n=1 Tax=Halalkalicoccus ordinarius TaxID=3116651 RepID=UPI00300EDD56
MNDPSSPSSLAELPKTSTDPEATAAVDDESRWWYWIAAYPVYSLLAIPLTLLAVVLFASVGAATAPMGPAGPDRGVVGPAMSGVVALVVGIVAIYALLGLVLTLLLPVALYLDATELTESTVAWSPDPILYGLVGLLNFLAAPVVGIIVALYYLYRRHEHVGTP